MAGFDAATAVEPLDVKGLASFGVDDFTIPDPTSSQLRRFAKALDSIGFANQEASTAQYAEAGKAARAEVEKRAKAEKRKATQEEIDEAVDRAGAELDKRLMTAVAHVCGDVVTADQLEVIPSRVFRAFFWWLWGEFVDPTVSSPATRPSLTALQGGKSAS